ncbi:hypothetical protein [Cytophaga hutchinsonii]|uniref:Protein involved in gliding motility RemB n=1 Tax=Cytophaga hutchinsonii (strain ATCC 33406 / DSM 1761 / CIP 103989 / NBRC 15051 / NCIMB 9469 / D465) TaxID=269798 RepID=A0A6N4SPK3_CYTH3|nr:hypothetical protein [Cytophaga hutchinsonii]ABG58200.1 protein involved in gliding motility RemB [Cytophaga hutchinsonii ATCC 33406]SFX55354.1 hypothetical protein SAMN04487930_105236 [Cytophaga hutchinsonii ATCC 33406]
MHFRLTGILFFLAIFSTAAQSRFSPLERQYLLSEEAQIHSKENNLHTSIQPYFINETKSLFNMDSLCEGVHYTIKRKNFINKVADNFSNNYLVPVDSGIVSIRATPLFDLELSYDPSKKQQYYRNTRGVLIYGDFGQKFSFYTGFYENQASFPGYINTFIDSNLVVPGQGLTKSFKGDKGQDFGLPFGYVCYNPNRYLTVQFGQDKNFIGNGYRSLLRSDNTMNNPFFKLQTSFWHIKYMVLYEQFMDVHAEQITVLGKGYPKKYSTTHYLSWKVSKSFEFGLFESIVWQAADSNGVRGFDWAYLNPVIFLRPTEFYNGSADNALMGINLKYQILHNMYAYGQIILDDLKFDELKKKNSKYPQKYGFQLGARYFDIAKIKGLAVQGEFNYVMPYTYSHRLSLQNYSHYNQSLAHPQNANFIEWIGIIDYNRKRWSFSNRLVYCNYGADKTAATNYGHNIFADISQYPNYYQGNQIVQGYKNTLIYNTLTAAYIINPKVNMRLEASFTYRSQKNTDENIVDKLIGFSFKTALFNKYYDF